MIDELKIKALEYVLTSYKKKFKSFLMTERLHNYIEEINAGEGEYAIYRDFQKHAETNQKNHQTPLSQIQFLDLFFQKTKPQTILEIGTFVGYTSFRFTRSFPDAKITTIEKSHNYTISARKLWKKYCPNANIESIEGDAITVLNEMIVDQRKFDFIYIDANKSEYKEYFQLSLQSINKGGCIIIDNILWAGLTAYTNTNYSHPKIMNDLIQMIQGLEIKYAVIPAWDGVLICYP